MAFDVRNRPSCETCQGSHNSFHFGVKGNLSAWSVFPVFSLREDIGLGLWAPTSFVVEESVVE